jgi:hypothetical protein
MMKAYFACLLSALVITTQASAGDDASERDQGCDENILVQTSALRLSIPSRGLPDRHHNATILSEEMREHNGKERQVARPRWVRLPGGEKCDSPLYRPIDDFIDCIRAFRDLKVEQTNADIISTTDSGKPKGCSSSCFDRGSDHVCRAFNNHPTGNRKGADAKLFLLCKNESAQYGRGKFPRITTEGETCESENLRDVETFEECKQAFIEEMYRRKKSEYIAMVSNPSEPNGCYSDCFDTWGGYSCRKFNKHAAHIEPFFVSVHSRNMLCYTNG